MMIKSIRSDKGEILIDLDTAVFAGGETGSVRVQDEQGNSYQYKPAIQDNSLIRKIKSGYADSENFGELLAARIAKSFDHSEDNPRVPSVLFVTSVDSPRVAITSRYLTGGDGATVQSLDDYLGKPREKSHIKLISGHSNPKKGYYNIDKDPSLKVELARAIALSALVGDHDVNPGNMIVIKELDGKIRLGRIDYGHAFNDLLRFSRFGGHAVHKNNIIDFFNRSSVNGLNSKSKLWRDYPGLTPSKEMVNALKVIGHETNAIGKIRTSINEVRREVDQLIADPNLDKDHIIYSFQRIAQHVSGEKIDDGLSDSKKLDIIFEKIEKYTHKNQQQMAYAAKVMHLQVCTQEAVKNNWQTLALKETYDKLVKEGEMGDLGPFSWFKERDRSTPYQGSFEGFLEHQKAIIKLDKIAQEIDRLLNNTLSKTELSAARKLKAIVINPKKEPETKLSLLKEEIRNINNIQEPKGSGFLKLIISIIDLFTFHNPVQLENIVYHESPTKELPQVVVLQNFRALKSKFTALLDPKKSEELDNSAPEKNDSGNTSSR